jgi:hypothetical protein
LRYTRHLSPLAIERDVQTGLADPTFLRQGIRRRWVVGAVNRRSFENNFLHVAFMFSSFLVVFYFEHFVGYFDYWGK